MSNAWNTEKIEITLLSKKQILGIIYETMVNSNVRYGVDSSEAKAVNKSLECIKKFIEQGKADSAIIITNEERQEFLHRYEDE